MESALVKVPADPQGLGAKPAEAREAAEAPEAGEPSEFEGEGKEMNGSRQELGKAKKLSEEAKKMMVKVPAGPQGLGAEPAEAREPEGSVDRAEATEASKVEGEEKEMDELEQELREVKKLLEEAKRKIMKVQEKPEERKRAKPAEAREPEEDEGEGTEEVLVRVLAKVPRGRVSARKAGIKFESAKEREQFERFKTLILSCLETETIMLLSRSQERYLAKLLLFLLRRWKVVDFELAGLIRLIKKFIQATNPLGFRESDRTKYGTHVFNVYRSLTGRRPKKGKEKTLLRLTPEERRFLAE